LAVDADVTGTTIGAAVALAVLAEAAPVAAGPAVIFDEIKCKKSSSNQAMKSSLVIQYSRVDPGKALEVRLKKPRKI
jgi:hypothetical protein